MLEHQLEQPQNEILPVLVLSDAETNAPEQATVPPITEAEREEIDRFLRRVGWRNRLRGIAEIILLQETPSADTPHLLMETLRASSGRQWKDRVLAAWISGRISCTPEQKKEITATLVAIVEYKLGLDPGGRLLRWYCRTLLALSPFYFGAVVGSWSGDFISMTLTWLIAGIFASPPVLPVSAAIEDIRLHRIRAEAITALGRLQAVESLDVLAKAVCERNAVVSKAAEKALRAVLPLLTPEHYGTLGSETVPNLCRALEYAEGNARDSLGAMLLVALEKIGDGQAVADVRRMAEKSRHLRYREEAARILPTLLARQQQEQNAQILLRGASMPVSGGETLLRPAIETGEADPKQLLRASVLEEGRPDQT